MSRSSFSSIPDESAERFMVETADGIMLAAYRLQQSPRSGPALLWGHANGFAAGSYLPVLTALAPTVQVFAFDARGHGGSTVPPGPYGDSLHLDRFAHDLATVVAAVREKIGDQPLYFASHSFSGVAALRLGCLFGQAPWAGVTLFDPPLFPTPNEPARQRALALHDDMLARTRRRRRHWSDPETYAATLATRSAFANCRPDMLAAHARATLRPRPTTGDFELCCPPEIELAVYDNVQNDSTFAALANFPLPVHLVSADPDARLGQSWAGEVQAVAAGRLRRGRLTVVPNTSHLLPFERPKACLKLVQDMLRG